MRAQARTLLAFAAPFVLTACATMGPPQPPSLDLPKPSTDLRAKRKGDRVTLTWTVPTLTTDRQTIRTVGTTEICRGLTPEMQDCGTPAAKIPAPGKPSATPPAKEKATATYTDTLPAQLQSDEPSAFATYAVEVLNLEGRGAGLSNRVHVSVIRTLAAPSDFQARVVPEGVVLGWTGVQATAPPGVHYVYRVFRRGQNGQQSAIGEVGANAAGSYTFADSQIEWEKTYEYSAEAVTIVPQPKKQELQVEGDSTAEIKVFAHDVFPPAVPSGLQAVFSGPGQQRFIDLVWAPVSDVDLAGYNIYRHTEGSAAIKVNAELVKTPAYRDKTVDPGTRYFYSVSSGDSRGNESARSEEASETVP
jgi:hypothetical protein